METWYKNYMLSRREFETIEERPYEFVYYVIQRKREILDILEDDILLCLIEPDDYI